MDPGAIGGLIGVGIMLCVGGSFVGHDLYKRYKKAKRMRNSPAKPPPSAPAETKALLSPKIIEMKKIPPKQPLVVAIKHSSVRNVLSSPRK